MAVVDRRASTPVENAAPPHETGAVGRSPRPIEGGRFEQQHDGLPRGALDGCAIHNTRTGPHGPWEEARRGREHPMSMMATSMGGPEPWLETDCGRPPLKTLELEEGARSARGGRRGAKGEEREGPATTQIAIRLICSEAAARDVIIGGPAQPDNCRCVASPFIVLASLLSLACNGKGGTHPALGRMATPTRTRRRHRRRHRHRRRRRRAGGGDGGTRWPQVRPCSSPP